MKDMSLIMKEAHKMTKKIKAEYKEVDYKFQLGLCISYLLSERVERKMELKELKGSEKQVKWANDIRKNLLSLIEGKSSLEILASFVEEVEDAKFFIDNFKVMTSEYADDAKRMRRCKEFAEYLRNEEENEKILKAAKENEVKFTDDMLKARMCLVKAKKSNEDLILEATLKGRKVRSFLVNRLKAVEKMIEMLDEGKIGKDDCEEILWCNETYEVSDFARKKLEI